MKLREGSLTALMVTLVTGHGGPCHVSPPNTGTVPTPRTLLTFRPEEESGAASGAWNSPYFSYLEIFYLHPPTYPPSLALLVIHSF